MRIDEAQDITRVRDTFMTEADRMDSLAEDQDDRDGNWWFKGQAEGLRKAGRLLDACLKNTFVDGARTMQERHPIDRKAAQAGFTE